MRSLRDWLVAATRDAAAGRSDAAIDAYRHAIALAPTRSDLRYNLGVLLAGRDDVAGAEQAFGDAQRLAPDWPAVPLALGELCYKARRYADAQRHFQRAVALAPDSVQALGNLAMAWSSLRRFDLALPCLERARALAPADEDVWFALRSALLAVDREEDAHDDFLAFERAAKPSARLVAAGLLMAVTTGDEARIAKYLPLARDWPYSVADAPLVAGVMARLQYLDVPRATILHFYRIYNRLQQANRQGVGPFATAPVRHDGPLRVGYLSADFRDHVMGRLLLSIFEAHDRDRFEIRGYSLTPAQNEDAMTERFRASMHSLVRLTDDDDVAAARRIAADRLDVLVDLMAHSSFARPAILGYKPAQVIVTHLGYHGCVGLEEVDFKLTDRHADVSDAAQYQLEAPLAMTTCVLPVRRVAAEGPAPERAALGIAADAVVLGAFVGLTKLSTRCLALWREILERVPNTVVAFSPYRDAERAPLTQRVARAGIAGDRIAFIPATWQEARDRSRYAIVDAVLDTLPYTGGDTTVAALDMCVPVVTRVGERHAERMTYSVLAHLGVTETVAASDEEYVAIACRLAQDAGWRGALSTKIRDRFAATRLADPVRYTRALEAAFDEALARKTTTND